MNITILPNREIITLENETLMQVVIRHHFLVNNICNGQGTCGKCKVRILSCVPQPNERDLKHLNECEINNGVRLACTVIPQEGMIVELDFMVSQDRKEGIHLGMKLKALNPGVRKIFINPSKPTLADERGDWDRIVDELCKVTGKPHGGVSLNILSKVPEILRTSEYALTVAVYKDRILDVEAGDTTQRLYGVAVDIGTTSVAVALVDLNKGEIVKVASTENEQTAYGADVISRITYAGESPENALNLRAAVRRTINKLLEELTVHSEVNKKEILKMTIVGNTTMQHLLLGFDVSHLAVSPFVSVCNRFLEFKAEDLEIDLNPNARIFLLPNIGGFVGSDTLGAILGAPIVLDPGNHLLVDLGTNCELFLKTEQTMMACSTAAGPAFEGAGITHGMRAKQGAIESVSLMEVGTVNYQVIGEQEASGICGSGLIEGIDELRKVEILTKQGKFVDPEKTELPPEFRKRIIMGEKGREFVFNYRPDQEPNVTLSQRDIGQLQLAKGAVCAGIKTLVEMSGITLQDLDTVILSGTFASYLKAHNIINIGLVPDVLPEKIKMVGNAAHVGALLALLDQHELERAKELYSNIKHVELGGSAKFSNYFMSSMYLERQN
ncbi:ASKHA domain-containing protein [Desulfosporosinus sp. SB140]|uniref:ASKHA domain-containing protein n=1 Tax=Desulfosporosinus paludis TaxID=3115649 RepID=UPI00388D1090